MNKIVASLVISITCAAVLGCSPPQNGKENKSNQSENIEQAKKTYKTYSAKEFFKTTSVFGSSINHDATAVLVSSDESGIFNAYKQPIDGSPAQPLTHSTVDSIYVISWFPQDDRILYSADKGGDEQNHIYVRSTQGEITDLTPGDKHTSRFVGWHKDNSSFYIATNERDPKYFDLYQYDVENYTRELVFQNSNGHSIADVSPNGHWLALNKDHSNTNSDVYIADLTNKDAAIELVTKHTGDVENSTYTFTRDSKELIYSTTAFGEFDQAWSYNIETKNKQVNYKADWDVRFTYFSKDGKYQVTGINADAQTVIDIVDTSKGQKVTLPELPKGDLRGVSFSTDSSIMVFYVNSDTSPSNLYAYKFGDKTAKRLTNTGNPDINEADLVDGEIVRFKSFDGLEIPGILYKPNQAETQKVPALIWIHGGPGGQSRKGYSALIQHLVNNGYAIFRINNRGSNGYGKTFYHLDDKKHGEDDLQDVVYNKKYLQSLPWVDKGKIGVIGGSYGGYLTMAAMAFTEEFEVGINIFGVTNWVRTLESIPPYWEAFRKSLYDELGDPAVDGERLHRISPVFFGHQVKKPVLVVQGANDPRVLQIESDEMVEAIRKGGTYVDYLIFDDEGHGFSKKQNRIEASDKYLQFLSEYLPTNSQ